MYVQKGGRDLWRGIDNQRTPTPSKEKRGKKGKRKGKRKNGAKTATE